MARPSGVRNFFGRAVNAVLPGTPYNRYSGQYSGAEVGKGILTGIIQAANPVAGQVADYARGRTGGTPAWDANTAGQGWLQNQYNQGIKPQSGLPYMPGADFAPINGVDLPDGWQPEAGGDSNYTAPRQDDPTQLAGLVSNGYTRDGRSGSSAGSSVLAEGQAAQDMVGGWQLASFLNGPQGPRKPGAVTRMRA